MTERLMPEAVSGVAGQGFGWGVAKLVKALDFDSSMRRFESFLPSHLVVAVSLR